MQRNPTLKEFQKALDVVRRFMLLLEPLLGPALTVADQGRPESETPEPAHSFARGPGRPIGSKKTGPTWQQMIVTVMQQSGRPMARQEIVQTIADIKNVAPNAVAGLVGRTLHLMKKSRKLQHDTETGIYRLNRPAETAPVVVERHHADT